MSDNAITAKLTPITPQERALYKPTPPKEPEPLPIWFFVGLILLVYGIIVTLAGAFMTPRPTVLAETRPALWWGAIMCVGGATFLGIGIKVHRSAK